MVVRNARSVKEDILTKIVLCASIFVLIPGGLVDFFANFHTILRL